MAIIPSQVEIIRAGEVVEKMELSNTAGGTATMENIMEVPQKIDNRATI